MTDRRRTLGLALQLVAALTSAGPLAAFTTRLVVGRSGWETRNATLAPVALCALQFAAGWLLVYRPQRARRAAIALAAGAIGVAAWSLVADLAGEAEHARFRAVAQAITTCAWPIAAAIAAWRATGDTDGELRRRPEAGGVLVAYGVTLLALVALRIAGFVLMWGRFVRSLDVVFDIPGLVDIAIGLLAIRAGTELVTGTQHGRPRVSIVMWVGALGYPLAFAAAGVTVGLTRPEMVPYLAAGIPAGAVAKILPLAIMRWHAGPIERTATVVGAPDPDAAATPLAWVHLWFAVQLAVVTLAIVRGRLDGEATFALVAIAALCVANAVAFTVAIRHGVGKRRAAVVAIVLSGLLLGVFIVVAFTERVLVPGNPMMMAVAMVAVPATLVWLGRKQLRGRGLGSVFE